MLATLEPGSVDLVYIDPPYNTGNDFAYRDDPHGTGGSDRHRAWTAMMRPRLEAARGCSRRRGAIFVSIDDNEVAHLRLLLDEVFGERNFVAQVVVNLNPKGRQLGSCFATSHEYLLVYARDAAPLRARREQLRDAGRSRRLPAGRRRRPPLPAPAAAQHQQEVQPGHRAHPALPGVGRPRRRARSPPTRSPGASRSSRSSATARPRCGAGRRRGSTSAPTTWSAAGSAGSCGERVDVFQKDWLHEGRRKKMRTIWLAEEVGSTDTAVAELKEIVGQVFESPKPTGLVRRILATMPADARVLDFFAGSGTTGHAVALANAGRRRHPHLPVASTPPSRPGGLQRPLAGLPHRRRHHPRPAGARSPRRSAAGSSEA